MDQWWVCGCCKGQEPYPYPSSYYAPPRSGCQCCGDNQLAIVFAAGTAPSFGPGTCPSPVCGGSGWQPDGTVRIGETCILTRCVSECDLGYFSPGSPDALMRSVYKGCCAGTIRYKGPSNCTPVDYDCNYAFRVTCATRFGPDSNPPKKLTTVNFSFSVRWPDMCPDAAQLSCTDLLNGWTCNVTDAVWTDTPFGGNWETNGNTHNNSGAFTRRSCASGDAYFTPAIAGITQVSVVL